MVSGLRSISESVFAKENNYGYKNTCIHSVPDPFAPLADSQFVQLQEISCFACLAGDTPRMKRFMIFLTLAV